MDKVSLVGEIRTTERESTLRIEVRVKPRAKRSEVTGIADGRLLVSLNAPPVEGEANKALVRFLGDLLGIAPSKIRIASGQRSRIKLVDIPIDARDALLKISP